ncbi:MAG: fumarylacetoacetate hydrolase family protein [Roseovarius sp.]|nr:fumarylacetoacetate hydrolase family protein [Roseovarius sp.]MCY4317243.1 fumarylacetoacetate hydrolase family protein [Roseovarius sp.]
MTDGYMFDIPSVPALRIAGDERLFPVRRIFCVGRNYAEHAAEMGGEVDPEAPFYFTKSAFSLCSGGAEISYPSGTENCHYEMEFVVAIGGKLEEPAASGAMNAVFGYGCGIDLTRRDLQSDAKEKRRPWDLGKDFENSAVVGPLTPARGFGEIANQRITLRHNGEVVQNAALSDMVWPVPEIMAHLSGFYRLMPGDMIMTGTPAGVGPIRRGSVLEGAIDGLEPVLLKIKQ